MTDYRKPAENLASDVKEYVDLKMDDIKLKTAKGLSISLGRVITALILLFSGSLAIIALTLALVVMVGEIMGNYMVGAFIAFGVYLLLFLILFFLRKKLFVNGFVKMFIQIFFPEDE